MKKIFKIIILCITIISVVFSFSACTEKPWNYDMVTWTSVQPEMNITKKAGQDWIGYLVVDDKQISVELLWGPTRSFDIINLTDYKNETPIEKVLLLKGSVKYNKTSATLIIQEDNIFDNKYEQIVLTRKAIEE